MSNQLLTWQAAQCPILSTVTDPSQWTDAASVTAVLGCQMSDRQRHFEISQKAHHIVSAGVLSTFDGVQTQQLCACFAHTVVQSSTSD